MADEHPPQTPDDAPLSWKPDDGEAEPAPTTPSARRRRAPSRGPMVLVVVLAILLVAALGAAGYLYTQYSDRDDRVGELEDEVTELEAAGGGRQGGGAEGEVTILTQLLTRYTEVSDAQQACIDALQERPAAADATCAEAEELSDALRADLGGGGGGTGGGGGAQE